MAICYDVTYLIEVFGRLGRQGQDVVGAALCCETAKVQAQRFHLQNQLNDGIVDVLIDFWYLLAALTAGRSLIKYHPNGIM